MWCEARAATQEVERLSSDQEDSGLILDYSTCVTSVWTYIVKHFEMTETILYINKWHPFKGLGRQVQGDFWQKLSLSLLLFLHWLLTMNLFILGVTRTEREQCWKRKEKSGKNCGKEGKITQMAADKRTRRHRVLVEEEIWEQGGRSQQQELSVT